MHAITDVLGGTMHIEEWIATTDVIKSWLIVIRAVNKTALKK